MQELMEYRVKTKRSDEWVDQYRGAQVNPEMINLLVTGPTRVLKPNGKPLCIYLPGAAKDVGEETYSTFSDIRMPTNNRGYAAGAEPLETTKAAAAARAAGDKTVKFPFGKYPSVMSAILGSFDRQGSRQYCRLTAYTANEVEKWPILLPYFQRIAELLEAYVPDRYAAQAAFCERTSPEWVIPNTPFSTITVNNTYPTGVHTDKGDLDEGFSTLGTMRRGLFTGGWLTFPQYGVAADMQDGDVILMDAHEWHGNTPLLCGECGEALRKPGHRCEGYPENEPEPERVSVVSYFRTDMVECGSLAEEQAARSALYEGRSAKNLGLVSDEEAASAATLGIDVDELTKGAS